MQQWLSTYPEALQQWPVEFSSPLSFSGVRNSVPTFQAVLEAGADPNGMFDDQRLLAMMAMYNRWEQAELLLRYGAAPKAVDRNGDTVKRATRRMRKDSKKKLADLLKKYPENMQQPLPPPPAAITQTAEGF